MLSKVRFSPMITITCLIGVVVLPPSSARAPTRPGADGARLMAMRVTIAVRRRSPLERRVVLPMLGLLFGAAGNVHGTVADLAEKGEGSSGQARRLTLVHGLVLEGGTVEQGLDVIGQGVPSGGPRRDLALEQRVGGVRGSVARERGGRDREAVEGEP